MKPSSEIDEVLHKIQGALPEMKGNCHENPLNDRHSASEDIGLNAFDYLSSTTFGEKSHSFWLTPTNEHKAPFPLLEFKEIEIQSVHDCC